MKKIFLVEESLSDFNVREKPIIKKMRSIDTYDRNELEYDDEEDLENEDIDTITKPFEDVDVSDMDDEDDVIVDDDDDLVALQLLLRNELIVPEVDREYLTFSLKSNEDETIEAMPMAELSKGDAFLFKVKGSGYKKIKITDIVLI